MGRKLRMMLIDDRPVTQLETEFLELQPVPYGKDEVDPSLGTWAQHLRLWSDGLFDPSEPDLVLIDCRFEDDSKYVPMSEELRGHDPRGLMHGAIFVARMFGRDRFHPFGFSVYSMDASGFYQDAYAQTFMGFLLAMRDSTLPESRNGYVRGRKDRDLIEICAQELGKTISQNPATAWGPALKMYRQRLKEVADLQAIVLDGQSWLKATDAVQRQDFESLDAGRIALSWRRFDNEVDSVDLRSLFADLLENDRWSRQANEAAAEWLSQLLVLGDYIADAVEWCRKLLLEGHDPDTLPVTRGRDLHGQRLTRFFHACTGLVAWYENRVRGELQLSSSALILELGLADKQLNRYFKPLLNAPWGRIVDKLDEGLRSGVWPLPAQWELYSVLKLWTSTVRREECPLTGPGHKP